MIGISSIFKKAKDIGPKATLIKACYYLRGFFYRIYTEKCGPLQVTGKIYFSKKNAFIKIGRCMIWKHVKFDIEGTSQNEPAVLEIGDFTTIGDRTEFHVAEKIIIGKRCRISWDCVIMDRNYHGIGNAPEIIRPVVIEDDVWIGCRAIILPGVRVGAKSVIGAGSVVTKNVPPNSVVGGNPAVVIRRLDEKN